MKLWPLLRENPLNAMMIGGIILGCVIGLIASKIENSQRWDVRCYSHHGTIWDGHAKGAITEHDGHYSFRDESGGSVQVNGTCVFSRSTDETLKVYP